MMCIILLKMFSKLCAAGVPRERQTHRMYIYCFTVSVIIMVSVY